jgi:hypothetical protein
MRNKKKKCRYCKQVFETNQRGRPQLYCCPSHRQRYFEKRRLAELRSDRKPLKLLAMDIKARQQKQASLERVVRQVVLKVLSEVLPKTFPLPQSPGPSLHLIKGGTTGTDKSRTD